MVPDIPVDLDITIKREQYLAKQALADTQTSDLVRIAVLISKACVVMSTRTSLWAELVKQTGFVLYMSVVFSWPDTISHAILHSTFGSKGKLTPILTNIDCTLLSIVLLQLAKEEDADEENDVWSVMMRQATIHHPPRTCLWLFYTSHIQGISINVMGTWCMRRHVHQIRGYSVPVENCWNLLYFISGDAKLLAIMS